MESNICCVVHGKALNSDRKWGGGSGAREGGGGKGQESDISKEEVPSMGRHKCSVGS